MAYPRIFQRLFANAGAGPLLRSDIIPRDIQSDSYRLSRIGCPHSLASTVLPPEYMWADGSLALLSDWPEFSARYSAGALTGMVMPYGSNQNVYMGKFMVNANGTGLYLPRLGGQFVRNWCPGAGEAGRWYRDEIRDITGWIGPCAHTIYIYGQAGGVFYQENWDTGNASNTSSSGPGNKYTFAASRVVPTGPENVPPHIRQPITIYMGRHA